MSTAVSQAQMTTTLPKSVAMVKTVEEKPRFNRSSSIDTIKRINTYICSPQSYLLPAILTTWLKTGQNGLQQSTEKTIFMFRSLIFGSFLLKFLLNRSKTGQASKLDFQTVLLHVVANLQGQLSQALQSAFVISLAFKLAVVVMVVQVCLCAFYLSQSVVPVGLSFLIFSAVFITSLGYRIKRFYLMKRDVKRKLL